MLEMNTFLLFIKGLGMDVKRRIKCGWMKWREVSGVLCNKRILMRLKSKVYCSEIPNSLYGSSGSSDERLTGE